MLNYPKPVVTFMQGFTMGGGVGVGCHGIAPDCLRKQPDCHARMRHRPGAGCGRLAAAGARAGALGEYLGLTGDRMDAGDAIYAGFADHFIPQDGWDA